VFSGSVVLVHELKAKLLKRIALWLQRSSDFLLTAATGPVLPDGGGVLEEFVSRCRAMSHPRVLELGTKQSTPGRSTKHNDLIPSASEYLGTDIEAGPDVDIVADVHRLTTVTGEESFDAIVSCSSFEHFKYPHLAAHQVMKALKVGGFLFIQTHQTFPIHSYPYDYFRFSREALAGLFGTAMGFRVIATDFEFPARIYARREPLICLCPAFLNVRLVGQKIGKTPDEYVFEYDVG
jgi:SAM-dependent methyltransferase